RPGPRYRGARRPARARPGDGARGDRARARGRLRGDARHRPEPHRRHRADADPRRARPEGCPRGVRGAVSTPEFVYLSQEDVVAAGGTDMGAMVDVIERAFRVKADGGVRMPP